MQIQSYEISENKKRISLTTNDGTIWLLGIKENIIRCVYTKREMLLAESPIGIEIEATCDLTIVEKEKEYVVSTGKIYLKILKETGRFLWGSVKENRILLEEKKKELSETPLLVYSTGEEEPKIRRVVTVDGERNFVENLKSEVDHMSYRGKLHFVWEDNEQIHGLGQGEEGIYNYRGTTQYLYQHNMRIPIPFFVSSKKYGILADCGSLMTFNDDERGSYLYMDSIEQLDYYFIAGESMDQVIAGYRYLTGKAVMLPKWAYGYIQSKEAYKTQEELVQIAKEYRKRKVGLDCVVQDWNTWEDGSWGNKIVDKERYPNLSKMNDELHDMDVHSMISVWPNMNTGTENYEEMQQAKFMLHDFATYNAFDSKARALYWKQAEKELFHGGFDSWWCDSTEPFSGPDWGGEILREPWERFQIVGEEHKKFLRADRANLYATAHAKGIFENQRISNPNKRVLNLTRSGYASIQKYGAMLWSGDTCATWETFRKQITEGLNMCMSGMPYWTLDIGAFFTVKDCWANRGCGCHNDATPKWFWQGDYEEGVADLGYRELYLRWFQYGAFLPMFRSHGTDTPREIWNFGEPGEVFYDALKAAIDFRYQLMPYIYSIASSVYQEDKTMMRSLLFDYAEDEIAVAMDREFLFGESILVCPVTKPMYYEKKSQPLECKRTQQCYLPKGECWNEYHTGKRYEGGQWVEVKVTLERIPIFIKAGSIIPMEKALQYASEEVETPFEIHIYPGKDCQFVLYEDAGDDYKYEDGICNRIVCTWKEEEKKLTIGKAEYDFPQSIVHRACKVILEEKEQTIDYHGDTIEICF